MIMETILKLKCNKCGNIFDDKHGYCNGNNNTLSVFVEKKDNYQRLGGTMESICPDCLIKAEITLRDFLRGSEYFKDEGPF